MAIIEIQDKAAIIESLREMQGLIPDKTPPDVADFLAEFKNLSEEDLQEFGDYYSEFGKAAISFCQSMRSEKGREDFYNRPRTILRQMLGRFIHFDEPRVRMVVEFVKQYGKLYKESLEDDEGAWACFACVGICLFACFLVFFVGTVVSLIVAAGAGVVISIVLGLAWDIVWAAISLKIGLAAFGVAVFICGQFEYCR